MSKYQEAFNISAAGLLKQMQKSEDGGRCLYRGYGGLKCAAGFLIPDDQYDPEMEGKSVCGDKVRHVIESLGYNVAFCMELQQIHDDTEPENLRSALKELAEEYSLVFPAELEEI